MTNGLREDALITEVGNLRDLHSLPFRNTRDSTTARTASWDDLFSAVLMTSASANTYTIPSDSIAKPFRIGHQILVVQFGAGQTTITAAGGVTINGTLPIAAQFGKARVWKTAANEWLVLS